MAIDDVNQTAFEAEKINVKFKCFLNCEWNRNILAHDMKDDHDPWEVISMPYISWYISNQ